MGKKCPNRKSNLSSVRKRYTVATNDVTDGHVVGEEILARLRSLENSVGELSHANGNLNRNLQSMHVKFKKLQLKYDSVIDENKELKKELRKLKHDNKSDDTPDLNSGNSSIPSSKESITDTQARIKRTQSQRVKSGRKPGGQPGHKGTTLHQREEVDETKILSPNYCNECGEDISDVKGKIVERRQVIDIFFPMAFTMEYISFEKECSNCGSKVRTPFPEGVNAPVCYGPNLQAFVIYLNEATHMPIEKVTELIKELFGVSMSNGTVCGIISRAKETAKPAYREIHDLMKNEKVVGADETTENINGALKWLWAWQSERLTYLAGNKGRGSKDFDSEYPDGLPNSILVTDRLEVYYPVEVKGHQICIAHLLRNLEYLNQLDPSQTWSSRMQALFRYAIHQRKTINWDDIEREDITKRFEDLLNEPLEKMHIEFGRLQRSLRKWKDAVFTFIHRKDVPYDNNSSEGAIRKAKIKMKIAQCFRSEGGEEAFTILHSIMDTARKNSMSPYKAILAITNSRGW